MPWTTRVDKVRLDMLELLDRRMVVVTGKGGVGKTTMSCAIALEAAGRGKRVLLAMCNARERASRLLGVAPIDSSVREILPHLAAVNITPRAALEEYALLVLKMRVVAKAIFDNRAVSSFLRGVPGIEAWSMLGKAYYHAVVPRLDGSPQYDLVVLDAPATGHGLDMLRVPLTITRVAPSSRLRRDAEEAVALLRDRTRSAIVLVTLPDEMPTIETLELAGFLRDELAMPPSHVVLNQILPTLFSEPEHALIAELGKTTADDLVRASVTRSVREIGQDRARAQLDTLGLPHATIPFDAANPFGREAVARAASALFA